MGEGGGKDVKGKNKGKGGGMGDMRAQQRGDLPLIDQLL